MRTRIIAALAAAFAWTACAPGSDVESASSAATNGAAQPNKIVNLTATFTAELPVYRTDGEPGEGFEGFDQEIELPLQTWCLDTRTLLSSPALCTTTTPTFSRLNLQAGAIIRLDFSTRCEAATFDLGVLSEDLDFIPQITSPGALRLYADAGVSVTLPPITFLGRVIHIPPIPLDSLLRLEDQAIGYVTRGKDEDDVEAALGTLTPLFTDPDAILGLLGGGGLLGGLLDSDGNLALDLGALTPEDAQAIGGLLTQLWPFLQVVSPVYLPPFHAYHDACRTEEEVELDVRFKKLATYVQARSGNELLNFKGWTPAGKFFDVFDAFIHYQAAKSKAKTDGETRAQGFLLSKSGLFFIDLSQLEGPGNVFDELRGDGVAVKACMTLLPWKCAEATLKADLD